MPLFIYLGSLIVGWATATARGASYLEPVTVSSPHPPPPHKRDRPHHTVRTVRGFFRLLMSPQNGYSHVDEEVADWDLGELEQWKLSLVDLS